MNIRRAGRLLLDLLFPLYTLASTPERRRYWRDIPVRRTAKLFAAVFFILFGVAFFIDLLAAGSYPLWSVLFLAGALGALHVILVLTEFRHPRLVIAPVLMSIVIYLVFSRLAQRPRIVTTGAGWQRMVFDVTCLFAAMMLSYRLFLSFTTSEGIAHVRLQTELRFAHEIQTTLVPPITHQGAGLEAYGRTVPSDGVGGDLVDLVVADGRVIVYVADVSGHGIPAGLLMGMVKTAMRQGLLFGQPLPTLLDGVNHVLPAVKEPVMYATLAALRFDGSTEVEYITAGHLPLLHYRRSKQDVARCGIEQFPLGMFGAGAYKSKRVQCEPGDLFAIVTDGLTETTDFRGQEFGLDRLEHLLIQHAARPLTEIFHEVLDAVVRHGAQQDDRTLLLVRVLG